MASQPRPTNLMPNGAPAPAPGMPTPGAIPLLPNQGRIVQSGSTRILCVADVRGNLSSLNDLARTARADYIIHTGDFGFYDDRSLDRVAEKTLKHVIQYSPLISDDVKRQVMGSQNPIRDRIPRQHLRLSQLPEFLNGTQKFDVPIYAVWGACEDVGVLEKLRSGEYKIDKLHILDETNTRLLEVGGIKLRLMGLGGAMVMHKLFDNGDGRTTIAGGQGTMWATFLQMGELIDTANRVYDPSETRIFITHASPARDGLLNALLVALKTDFSISAGLHFRYGSSYNEFSVNPSLDHYRGKLASSRASFDDVWETVKALVEPVVAENDAQQKLLENALEIVKRMPSNPNGGNPFGGVTDTSTGQIDEVAFKNTWHFNLADAAFGYLVLEIEGGRIGTEMKAQGFNFAHRGMKTPSLQNDPTKNQPQPQTAAAANTALPPSNNPNPQFQSQPSAPAPVVAAPPYPAPQQPRAAQPTSQGATQPPAVTKSPAPATPSGNPSVPSPVETSANGAAESIEVGDSKTNGVTSPAPGTEGSASRGTPPMSDKKPSTGIFISNVKDEEEARNLFSEEDRAKIVRITKAGKFGGLAAFFSTSDEMESVYRSVPSELKRPNPGKPSIRIYQDRTMYARTSYGQGGYRSGGESGGASDRESGRGNRGSLRGGRGGRGGPDRGRGPRGGGRGRGATGEAGGPSSPSPVTPSQTTSS